MRYLQEHKFKYSFQDSINFLCNYCREVQSTAIVSLDFPFFKKERRTLFSIISSIDKKLLNNNKFVLTQALLFGKASHDVNNMFKILTTTTEFILSTKRFHEPLLLLFKFSQGTIFLFGYNC